MKDAEKVRESLTSRVRNIPEPVKFIILIFVSLISKLLALFLFWVWVKWPIKKKLAVTAVVVLILISPFLQTLTDVYLAHPVKVNGNAMEPTYKDDQYLLVSELPYFMGDIKRGDIVVFKRPENKSMSGVGRVVALPTEKLQIREGKVYINENLLEESYLSQNQLTEAGKTITGDQSFTVADNSYAVLNDNRERPSDSREWGSLPRDQIIGKVIIRYR